MYNSFPNYPGYPGFLNNNFNNNCVSQINGKIINNPSEIGISDVPMDGSFAVFPKKDLSEIYIKQWSPNGNIITNTYSLTQPVILDKANNVPLQSENPLNEAIMSKLENIEKLLSPKNGKEVKEAKHE